MFREKDCEQVIACLEYNSGTVAIHPKFNKLIISLCTVVQDGDDSVDEDTTSLDLMDVLSALKVLPGHVCIFSPSPCFEWLWYAGIHIFLIIYPSKPVTQDQG